MFNCCGGRDYPWLTLSLECCIMVDVLIMLVEEKDGKTGTWRQKRRSKVKGSDVSTQSLLFPVDMEDRERFDKLARTLDIAINPKRKPHSKWDWSLTFLKSEIFEFMERWKKAEVEPMIEQMLSISRGEPLEDYEPLIKFLGQIQMSALHRSNDPGRGGGCF